MKKIIRGLLAALMLAPASLTARAATTIDPSDPGIYYSPGCWHVVKGSATEVTNGCYFKANLLDTSTVALNFNVAQQYVYANNFTQLWWRIDGAAGTWTTVSLTTSTPTVKLAIPATTNAPGWKQHMLEVVVKNSASAGNRWNPADPRREWAAVILTGITVDTGASAALPYVAPRKILVMGDSVTEGFSNACTGTACNAAGITSIEDARMSYAWVLLRDLGAEGSLIGFAGQSWDGPSPNSAPPFTASYNFLYQGVPRSFAGIDMVVINQGSNGGPSGADVPNVLNGMVAAGLTGIAVVICPFRTDTCAAEIRPGEWRRRRPESVEILLRRYLAHRSAAELPGGHRAPLRLVSCELPGAAIGGAAGAVSLFRSVAEALMRDRARPRPHAAGSVSLSA